MSKYNIDIPNLDDAELIRILTNRSDYVEDIVLDAIAESQKRGLTIPEAYESTPEAYESIPDDAPVFSGWISGLEFFSWLVFIIFVIAGVCLGIPVIVNGRVGAGILIICAGVSIGFLSVASTMVFLSMAKHITIATKEISDIKELLKNRK